MSKLLNIVFWGSLALFSCYAAVALSAGITALFQRDWRTVLVPIAALVIFMASGYMKTVIDAIKR